MKAIDHQPATDAAERLSHHPCFNQDARHKYARIHLPVAPLCNMQCNYCNRRYNCVNESRPGVTCAVLKPGQAIEYLRRYVEKNPHLSVVGIAGPGDPMTCAGETLETLRMAKAEFPHLLLCLASNGLNLPPYVSDLAAVGLSHVTVTVNAVDARVGARFYRWMEIDGRRFDGEEASAALWERQQRAIQELAAAGTLVKINTIYTPGINDGHIDEIAQTVSVLGASILNIMPLLPTAGTPFTTLPEPDRATLQQARRSAARHLPQMTHCARCRVDAAGLIGEENMPEQYKLLQIAAQANAMDPASGLPMTLSPRLRIAPSQERPYVAVVSREGLFVNQHLDGEDSSRADLDLRCRVLEVAETAGATRFRFADTLGVLDPFSACEKIAYLRARTDMEIEIHAHNDLGLATANSLAAVRAGATHVSTTVNGLGERAGNAPLEEIAIALLYLENRESGIEPRALKELSALVAEASDRPVAANKAVVGSAIFTHESGIHVSGLLRDPRNYESSTPNREKSGWAASSATTARWTAS